jgi:hypothetical protein
MRTKFWANVPIPSTLLVFIVLVVFGGVVSSFAQQRVALASGDALTYSASGTETVFTIQKQHGRKSRLQVERDATVAGGAQPSSVKLIAETPHSLLVLTDTYPSIPGGMDYCQAGKETFLRVISIAGKRPVETYHVKLESCRDNVELGSPGVEWSADSKTLSIHWLSAPGQSGKAETRRLNVGPDGKPAS